MKTGSIQLVNKRRQMVIPIILVGFATAADRQKRRAFIRRMGPEFALGSIVDIRTDFEEMCNTADRRFFNKIFESPGHVLEQL